MPNDLSVDFTGSQPRQEFDLRPGSAQQEAIWLAAVADDYHIEVNALAGVGKTYSLEEMAKRLQACGKYQRIAYVVFSKANQLEAEQRMPEGVVVKTSHSLGFGAVRNYKRDVHVDQHKTDALLDEDTLFGVRVAACKLVSLCKNHLFDGKDADRLDRMAVTFGVDCNGDEEAIYALVPHLMERSKQSDVIDTYGVDFDDMIWLPYALNLKLPRYDVLMLDEAQDLNAAQQWIALKAGERIVYVGDRHQAIYGFRGADVTSMDTLNAKLTETRRGLASFPLTVTRRCPQSVTALASLLVPDFECLPEAPQGIIREVAPNTLPERGDMVLCRVNAPLMSAAFQLLRANIPARIQGRDFGQGLTALIKKLARNDMTMDVFDFLDKLEDYRSRELARISRSKHKQTIAGKQARLDDKCDCLRILAADEQTVGALADRIQKLFADVDAGQNHNAYVLLSTVHRAKGLEADTVHVLEPDLFCKFGKQPWEVQQEKNIAYVAVTRARKQLVWQGKQPRFLGACPAPDTLAGLEG